MSEAAPSLRPLHGLSVIDLSRVLAGPLCGQMLADMGADVIKVEAPGGDENRKWPPFDGAGESCNFMSVNRGKRGVTLNLKSEDGRALLYGLLGSADVLLLSFLPHTCRDLGVDPELLRRKFPRLVIVSITAFGSEGALAERPGYDSLSQAFSGIMSITGERDGLPVRSGVSFVDLSTGVYAYAGVLTALEARRQTGQGDTVRVSLLETAIGMLGYHAVGWLGAGATPHREGSGVWHLVPYQAFRCQDGEILTGALNDAAWQNLCRAVERPDLGSDPALASNAGRVAQRERLVTQFTAIFASAPTAYWMARLEACGVPVALLHSVAQALDHPQTRANGMVVDVARADGSALQLLGPSFKLDAAQRHADVPPPRLGEHTDAVLAERLGLDAARLAALRAQGVL
jgi:crotonobetainyl-CoA:carnitine CoA-transferase CaiB-like acyl-CoA transferase